ncbi:helix-turn-helix domain-containing protein [Actinokineospora iranica]|uniref:Transcriptional regulator, contains XRE-family HTH domain n=1 Tax=Actinokineospora iranica TaxID=1271860 RepID=A0A1G6M3X0_9PSEU|nr:XRE family transcriptional regulator [Actinokineospora iranica]SDC50193.1 Transcriptional regulator, contains XRE-family HTH domain [Actinokineospora iranica]
MDVSQVLAGIGARLKAVRQERGTTLAALAAETGISVSTLSRLESGNRKATLELLLPIARAHGADLDELVGLGTTPDPRVRAAPKTADGRTYWPLTAAPGQPRAFKVLMPATDDPPDLRTHEGYEWLFVLSGRLRLILGQHDLTMAPGEAAEFDTRVPHWLGSAGDGPVEVLILFGRQGERVHLRTRGTRGN